MENIKNRYVNSADLYDLDQRDNLLADIPFYLEYAGKQNGNILELGCGTGRVSLELAKAGYFVTGLDLSEPMLEIYKSKINKLPIDIQEKIKTINGNMADFSINKKFSLVIAPFRAFQALTNDDDIKNCLKCIKNHLNINGKFIFNAFRPYKILDETWCFEDRIQWERKDSEKGIHVVKKDCGEKIDIKNQIIYPKFTYEVTDNNGNIEKYIEHLELKYYYHEQIKKLLENNGFKIMEEYGWYDKSKIENGREIIIICE
jgi:SAM-dependent methyltransferase